MRLDIREGLFRQKDKVTVIVPGQPEASELVRRIDSDNPDEKMPPPDSHRQLTAVQRDVLRRWVKEGAKWDQHWSFAPLKKEPLPEVGNSSWVRNEIDRFVLKSLNAAQLTPKGEADRARLIRRVTLDLTGLPPTLNRNRRIPDRHFARRLRESRRPAAGFAALWGTPGERMARFGPLCRHAWISGRPQPRNVALSRLGH